MMEKQDLMYAVDVLDMEIFEQRKARNKLSLVPSTYENQGVGPQLGEIADRVEVLNKAKEVIKDYINQ